MATRSACTLPVRGVGNAGRSQNLIPLLTVPDSFNGAIT